MSDLAANEAKILAIPGDMSLPAASIPMAVSGLFAGMGGGVAEVVWIGLYSEASDTSGLDVARCVADTVFPGTFILPSAPALGLTIHFCLSAMLGILLVQPLTSATIWRSGVLLPLCLGILGLIWSLNFLLVLPVINPIFLALLPTWATFVSKMLFGAALFGVLCYRRAKAG